MSRPTSTRLRTQHTSLQFSDTNKQQEADVKRLFAQAQQYPIKTGTEAGPGQSIRPLLKKYAKEYDHRIHFAADNWIAVDRAIIKPGTVKTGDVFIVDNDKTVGRGHDTVMATMRFKHVDDRVGIINQGAVHYPVKGKPGDVNVRWTRLAAAKIANWMERVADTPEALAFVNGDFNIHDKRFDWAFGKNFTSMADELKAWENTGHGPIDGFCSYDKDHRVKAVRFTVLDDKEAPRFGDHYVCQGVWDVGFLKGRN